MARRASPSTRVCASASPSTASSRKASSWSTRQGRLHALRQGLHALGTVEAGQLVRPRDIADARPDPVATSWRLPNRPSDFDRSLDEAYKQDHVVGFRHDSLVPVARFPCDRTPRHLRQPARRLDQFGAARGAGARTRLPDCRVAVYDGLGLLPIFNPDDEGERTPREAARLIEAVTSADGIIVSCPEYAHGVPGGMKNALDWLVSRDAAVGKPAMLVHASARSLYARAALAEIMRTMSFAIYEDAVLEIALLGKKPPEMETILGEANQHADARRGARLRGFYTRRGGDERRLFPSPQGEKEGATPSVASRHRSYRHTSRAH